MDEVITKEDATAQDIERLRASKLRREEQERPIWTEKGRRWATKIAEFGEPENLADLDFTYADDGWDALQLVATNVLRQDADRSDVEEWAEFLTGSKDQAPTIAQVEWFVDGAIEGWKLVSAKL